MSQRHMQRKMTDPPSAENNQPGSQCKFESQEPRSTSQPGRSDTTADHWQHWRYHWDTARKQKRPWLQTNRPGKWSTTPIQQSQQKYQSGTYCTEFEAGRLMRHWNPKDKQSRWTDQSETQSILPDTKCMPLNRSRWSRSLADKTSTDWSQLNQCR